jgi:threonine dehydratase
MKRSRNHAKLTSFPSSSTSHTWIPMSSKTLEYSSHAPEPLSNVHLPKCSAPENENESRYPRLASHLLLPDGTPDYLRLILNSRVYDLVKETPLVRAANLSAKLGNEIWLKREDLQEVFSFKIRGAYNFMAHLSEEERWRGVVTCSAGSYVCSVKTI